MVNNRAKPKRGAALTVVDGGLSHRDNPGGDGGGELAEMREQLVAAGVPAAALAVLDGATDAGDALRRLSDAGVLPSPQEALAGLLDGWKPLLKRGVDPLTAELHGAEFLGMMREAGPDEAELPEVLASLIEHAEGSGAPEALALLRVLAVLGPPEIRPAATETADRLVAGGLVDPPWVPGLGAPQVGACFGYIDTLGSQQSVAISFTYGRKPHALVVLIDHSLGGGVKDCFPTDRPDRIRAEYQNVAKRLGLHFHDHRPAEARALLTEALAARPCPVEPDQVEDVGDYLGLLRQRVALLPDDTATEPAGTRPAVVTAVRTVHRMKITLRGSKPPIWRRLEVPSRIRLEQLHHSIQQAFGWDGHHLWVFSTPVGEYGVSDPELGHHSAAARKLDDVAPRTGDRFRYTYDFGDDWEHELLVEDVLTAEPGVAYPRCLTGRRACPPEDCGGIWGYNELREILADPEHPGHADRLEWLGLESAAEFDPAKIDINEVNEALSDLAGVLRQ